MGWQDKLFGGLGHLPFLAASPMAEAAALARADHDRHGRQPRVFEDPYALTLVNPAYRLLVRPRLGALAGRLTGFHRTFLAGAATTLVRSRYTEDALAVAAAAQGLDQYVILGAGLDSFAWRRPPALDTVRLFEVDLPAVLADKAARAHRAGLPTPARRTLVPLDLSIPERLPAALRTAGFDAGRPALFAWLGVAYYLTPEACCSLIAAVGQCAAPGSHFTLDVLAADAFAAPRLPELLARTRLMAHLFGESLPGGLLLEQLTAPLAQAGFVLAEQLGPDALAARYLAGRDDLREVLPHLHLVHATRPVS